MTRTNYIKMIDPVFCYDKTDYLAKQVYFTAAPEDFLMDLETIAKLVTYKINPKGQCVLRSLEKTENKV